MNVQNPNVARSIRNRFAFLGMRGIGSYRFCTFPPMARKVIYTTNSIESFNNKLRKATRNRVQFTNDESALKTLWLMICNIEDKRALRRAKEGKTASASAGRLVEGARVSNWKQAINQMALTYPDRFDKYM